MRRLDAFRKASGARRATAALALIKLGLDAVDASRRGFELPPRLALLRARRAARRFRR